MKTVIHTSNTVDNFLHVETDLGIVNIRIGLTKTNGEACEFIQLLPDAGVIIEDAPSGHRFVKKEAKKE